LGEDSAVAFLGGPPSCVQVREGRRTVRRIQKAEIN